MNTSGYSVCTEESDFVRDWVASLGQSALKIEVRSIKQGWAGTPMQEGIGLKGGELKVNGRIFVWGVAGHADCEIELDSPCPLRRLRGFVGIEENPETVQAQRDSAAVFTIECEDGEVLWRSQALNLKSAAEPFDVKLSGRQKITLKTVGVDSSDGHLPYGHVNWGELVAEAMSGEEVRIGGRDFGRIPDFLPMDFRFGDESMHELLLRCGLHRRQSGNVTVFDTVDAASGLAFEFRLVCHESLPVCEWRVVFANRGIRSTPRISNVKSLDMGFSTTRCGTGWSRLLRGRGSFNTMPQNTASFNDSFLPVIDDLGAETEIVFGAENGRCSDPWLPFFNLKFAGDGGLLFAIGWDGQWQARAESRRIVAGIEKFDAVILPGERLEFPSIYMIRYSGTEMLRGNNLLRRFLREQVVPRYQDEPVVPPVSCLTWGGLPEEEHRKRLGLIAQHRLPFEVYWIDAGWYAARSDSEFDPTWSAHVGDWCFNPEVLPHGTDPIADIAHGSGMKLLLWLELERAIAGTKLHAEHPEWFLGKVKKGANLLLDLGNEAACDWCINYISELIEKHGVDIYREDFNIAPLSYWRGNDMPDRQGITELKAVAGLHRLWGELRRRFPSLLIDNCSSGGRRINIELLRYSIPLWVSDMCCYPDFDPDCAQTHISGLSFWLPLFGSGTQNHEGGDTYHLRSCYAAGIGIHCFYRGDWPIRADYPYDWLRGRLQEFAAIRDCLSGDFYPLIETITHLRDLWSVSQYDRPDLGCGTIIAFRRATSPFTVSNLRLHGLQPDANYEFHDFDSGENWIARGDELTEKGLRIEMSDPRSSKLLSYRQLK